MSLYRTFKRTFKFLDYKQTKTLIIIFGIILSILSIITGFFYIKDYIIENTWHKKYATVINYNVNNPNNVWTTFKYEYENNEYTTTLKGHSYYMLIDSDIEILVNPDNPENIKIYKHLYSLDKTLGITIITLSFSILLPLLVIYIKKKHTNITGEN